MPPPPADICAFCSPRAEGKLDPPATTSLLGSAVNPSGSSGWGLQDSSPCRGPLREFPRKGSGGMRKAPLPGQLKA